MSTIITKVSSYRTWQNEGTSMVKAPTGVNMYDFTSLLTNYYTKSELQTIGQSEVHFANIINAYHNYMLGLQGGLIVGDSDNPDSSGAIDDEMFHLDEDTYLNITGIDFQMSIEKDLSNIVTLDNDLATPGNSKLYGTDDSGVKGWYDIPSVTGFVDVSGTPSINQFAIWTDANTITGSSDVSYDGRTFVFGGYPMDVPDVEKTMLGIGAILSAYTSAHDCVFIGIGAGAAITSGVYNTAIGASSLYAITSGIYNTSIGAFSLYDNTTGDYNTSIGTFSLNDNTTGNYNIAIGASSLNDNTTGDYNTAIGTFSLNDNTTGYYNTSIGMNSLLHNTIGVYNTAIGAYAGNFAKDGVTSNMISNTSIYLGVYSSAFANGDENEIVIGFDAVGKGSNTTIIGNYNTIGIYLVGEIYFVTYSENSGGSDTAGSLPLADSSITQIVMYDPATGKLYYGAGEGGTVSYTFRYSITESSGTVNLTGDVASPGNSKYYGTDSGGTRGWYDLPAGGGTINGSGVNTRIAYWLDADTLTSDSNFYYNGALALKGAEGIALLTSGLIELNDVGTINRVLLCPSYSSPGIGYAYMFDTESDIGTDKLLLLREAGAETFFVDPLAMHHHNDCNANFFVQKYTLGGTPVILHDAETSTANTAYTKLKTITLGAHVLSGRQLKIKFDLKMNVTGNPPYAYGRIYRNGVAIGTEQTNGTDSYVTKSEDIMGWYAGDTIELWAKAISTYTAYVRYFRVCGGHKSGIVNEVTGIIS